METIKKAVIPCGGLGTRFYPVSSVLPKEMLPLYNKPTIHYIVLDLIDNGINDICFVINKSKQSIVEYLTPNYDTIKRLRSLERCDDAGELSRIYSLGKFSFVYQQSPKGSGDAVLCAKEFVEDQPFFLSWGDDIIFGDATKQLLDAYKELDSTVIGVKQIDTDDIVKYGVVDIDKDFSSSNKDLIKCKQIVEKPTINAIPSRSASIGKYVLKSNIWDALNTIRPSQNGEYLFTDALQLICNQGVYACKLKGDRYDLGDNESMLKATIEIALKSGNSEIVRYLKNIIQKI